MGHSGPLETRTLLGRLLLVTVWSGRWGAFVRGGRADFGARSLGVLRLVVLIMIIQMYHVHWHYVVARKSELGNGDVDVEVAKEMAVPFSMIQARSHEHVEFYEYRVSILMANRRISPGWTR